MHPYSDTRIATEAARRLAWDAAIPRDTITLHVAHGNLTLSGELARDAQHTAMLEDVTRLFGVTRVTDRTTIKAKK
ncbi:osmotically-inducible protein OsmY [Paraburkholderia sp. GAS199]|uniref:BON domain-containing protein n=1 Tax=Paraburkholderia sp. GAS199 TaxID=3035126 RepID=UPI003D1FCC08